MSCEIKEHDMLQDPCYPVPKHENSSTSAESLSATSSLDMVDGASSSSSSSSSSNSNNGPLYELSELMTNLPIKRGLSRHYHGKSQSFTSLSRVTSLEDLPKKEIMISSCKRRKMKTSRSHGNDLLYTLPKAIITKKVSRPFLLSIGSFLNSNRPPSPPAVTLQNKSLML